MSENMAYVKRLERRYRELPWKATLMLSVEVYKTAMRYTYQDSGQFAFNWHWLVGAQRPREYTNWYGHYPVGEKRSHRGFGHPEVINFNLGYYGIDSKALGANNTAAISYYGGRMYKSVTVANPLGPEKYGPYPARANVTAGKGGKPSVPEAIYAMIPRALARIQDRLNRGTL